LVTGAYTAADISRERDDVQQWEYCEVADHSVLQGSVEDGVIATVWTMQQGQAVRRVLRREEPAEGWRGENNQDKRDRDQQVIYALIATLGAEGWELVKRQPFWTFKRPGPVVSRA
jgi:hypothetical protein